MTVPTIDRVADPTDPAYWDAIQAETRRRYTEARARRLTHACNRCGIDTTMPDRCVDCVGM